MTLTLDPVEVSKVRAQLVSGEARRIREEARLSQADIAGYVGVAPNTVARWEGCTITPNAAHAVRLGRLLKRLRARA